ncbi:MAG: type II toxin-antitoxin system Phd/YefM family antitoxin [Spirochaetaceae bacterium]|nr:type II toxin-antitoxin system Phd/YefM family antitoxin [Spirochaetaceae bacterium]
MTVISITEAKNKLTQIVHEVELGEPVELTRHGVPAVVLVSSEKYRELTKNFSSFSSLLQKFRESRAEYLLKDNDIFSGIRGHEEGREVEL